MKHLKQVICSLLVVIIVSSFCYAADEVRLVTTTASVSAAEDITSSLKVTLSNGQSAAKCKDDKITTFVTLGKGNTMTLSSDKTFTQVYIMWNKIPGEWTGTVNGTATTYGTHGFLHEYVQVASTTSMTITVPNGAQVTDVYAFTEGTLPDWVEVWEDPCEEADILLFSTHSDDEQLFFAGLLPYYAVVRNVNVQVVYMTNHWDNTGRPHEQLNGLWTVGIRHYPIISEFPDDARSLGSKTETKETVLKRAQGVYNEEDWIQFQVQLIRRFKAQVVVTHDFAGEYRHGAHILNADSLKQAITKSGDATFDSDSATKYGTWEVKKAYFHLYEENPIVMNYDTPSDALGGKTPFEVSQLGYACHDSQQWTWFTDWISEKKATDIATYNPCNFGLYFTSVGNDVQKNDMLENITSWAEIHAQEEEAKRKAEEEQAEAQRKAEEEAAKQEKRKKTLIVVASLIIVIAIIVIIVKRKEKARRRAARRRQQEGRRNQ